MYGEDFDDGVDGDDDDDSKDGCEKTLCGIFDTDITIVFDHAPAENCRRYRF